jgi:hypothetical protein
VKKLTVALASIAGLAVTANGYKPLSKRGYLSIYAFSFGVFATELPLQLIAGQFGLLAAVTRRLSPRLRRFSWLVSALSWLGLLGLHRIGTQANVPLTAALDAGLGADRRTESGDLWKRPDGAGTAKSPGVARMMRVYRDYAHDSDISYGEHGARNHLDIWRRPDLDRGGRAPVLLQVPGGAWMVGSKRQQAYPLMSHLAELGWVCVAINYRLSPRSTWPDHIVDRTGSRAPAARPVGTCRHWLPLLRTTLSSSPVSKVPTPVCGPRSRSTACTTSTARTARSTR